MAMTSLISEQAMTRFNKRHLQLVDLVGRFEAHPSSAHVRHAIGFIERMRDDGGAFWNEDSQQLRRWREYCTTLLEFLNTLGERRYLQHQDLATALREFIQEFEHSTAGMYQMLYGTADDPENDENIGHMVEWFSLAYRQSTYAILSTWIDDKEERVSVGIALNMTSGERKETWTRTEMRVPRKYRRMTKRL